MHIVVCKHMFLLCERILRDTCCFGVHPSFRLPYTWASVVHSNLKSVNTTVSRAGPAFCHTLQEKKREDVLRTTPRTFIP